MKTGAPPRLGLPLSLSVKLGTKSSFTNGDKEWAKNTKIKEQDSCSVQV